jgi:hypothetical protein
MTVYTGEAECVQERERVCVCKYVCTRARARVYVRV